MLEQTEVQGLMCELEVTSVGDSEFVSSVQGYLDRDRVYGGRLVAQALLAAAKTVEGKQANSLHAYFLRAGDPGLPIHYHVSRARDSRSFATRSVRALQEGKEIFSLMASFHAEETGLEFQPEMPACKGPEKLPELSDYLVQEETAPFYHPALDIRPCEPFSLKGTGEKGRNYINAWVRHKGKLPTGASWHEVLFSYISDILILDTGFIPHGLGSRSEGMFSASLDHAIWFHRPLCVDDWLLFSLNVCGAVGGRSLNKASVFNRNGELIASFIQDGLMRYSVSKLF